MSNFTPKQIVDHLIETTGDPKWFVNTKSIGFQVGHKWKQPQYVQRYVTEAVKQLSAKQKKIAKVAGDPDKIDGEDLATLRAGNNLPPEAKQAMKDIASSDAAPEHKQAAINALLKKHGISEGRMPKSIIGAVERRRKMSDVEFAMAHPVDTHSDARLIDMAWRHGYGEGSSHYVKRRNAGLKKIADEKQVSENTEQIDESGLKTSTLANYIVKSGKERASANNTAQAELGKGMHGNPRVIGQAMQRVGGRTLGMTAAGTILANRSKNALDKQARDEAIWGKQNEEVEQIDEQSPHSIVNSLKADGRHEEAGAAAFKHGLPREYGAHFGPRSTAVQARVAFHKGYDGAKNEKPYSGEYPGGKQQQDADKAAFMKRFAKEEVELDEGLEKISRDEFNRRHAAMKAALGDTGVHHVKRKFHMAVNKLLGHQSNTEKAKRNVYDGTYIMPKGGPKGEHRPLVHFKRSLAQKIGDAVFRRTGRADEYYAVTEQTTEELSGMKTYKQFVNQIDEGKGAGEAYRKLVDAVGKPMRSAMRPKNTPKSVKEDIVNENKYERVSDYHHKIVTDENPTHKVTVVNSPQGGAGWRGKYHTYEVHVNAENDKHAKELAVQAVRDHNKKGGWEPPFVPTSTDPDYPSVQKINEEKDLHPATIAILTGAKKSSASMRNKLLAMHGNHPQVKALIAKGDIDTGKGLSAKQASKSVDDDDEGDDGLEGPDKPLKAAAHPHGYVRTTATGGSVRQKNMERMRAAMAKGTAHGSNVGGGVGNASPVDKAFAPKPKSVGATGESPAEKQDAENAKKEAPKGQKRAPGRLTGKKLSMSGKED